METYRIITGSAERSGPYLSHYGVLGMKWGVRRTPEQLGRHRIKKGTTMHRITSEPNEGHTGHAYVSYLPPDRDRYRAWQLDDPNRKYEKTYKLTKDLNIPSRAELTDVIYQTIKNDVNKKLLNEVADVVFSKTYLSGDNWMYFFDKPEINKITAELNDIDDHSNAKAVLRLETIKRHTNDKLKSRFDKFMNEISEETSEDLMIDTMIALEHASNARSAIFNELSNRGYNAIIDENDVGGIASWSKRAGVEPLIVFDRNDTLSEISTKRISERSAKKSYKRYKRWQGVAESHRENQQW